MSSSSSSGSSLRVSPASKLFISAIFVVCFGRLYYSSRREVEEEEEAQRQREQGSTLEGAEATAVIGLRNIGNTCYFNSLLQALASVHLFQKYIEELREVSLQALPSSRISSLSSSSTTESPQLLELFLDLCNGKLTDPSSLHQSLSAEASRFASLDQHDAQELFLAILAILHKHHPTPHTQVNGFASLIAAAKKKSENIQGGAITGSGGLGNSNLEPGQVSPSHPKAELLSSSNTRVSSPFVGLTCSQLVCQRCGHSKGVSRYSEFSNLSLSISPLHPPSLIELLHRYTSRELVSGVTCDLCSYRATIPVIEESIGKLTRKQKTPGLSAERASQYQRSIRSLKRQMNALRLHLSRRGEGSILDDTYQLSHPLPLHMVKCDFSKALKLVRFPPILILHINRLQGNYKDSSRIHFERYLDAGRLAQIPSQTSLMYHLCSVVVHHGSAFGGHYTTYRRRVASDHGRAGEGKSERGRVRYSSGDGWIHTDDERIRESSWEEVQRCEAYLLFYSREEEDEKDQFKTVEGLPRHETSSVSLPEKETKSPSVPDGQGMTDVPVPSRNDSLSSSSPSPLSTLPEPVPIPSLSFTSLSSSSSSLPSSESSSPSSSTSSTSLSSSSSSSSSSSPSPSFLSITSRCPVSQSVSSTSTSITFSSFSSSSSS